jgi:hypothetical protein
MRPRSPAATRRVAGARERERRDAVDAAHDAFGLEAGGGRRCAGGRQHRAATRLAAQARTFIALLRAHAPQRVGLEVRELAAHAEDRRALSSKLAKASVYAPELRS